ncbi:hypothetical protein [Corynebacterium alimapuense]|uniref:SPOR domain-containing protein n=1 Tax=Corynebacterium alimapuense TaxID=1576874 RepID=A0A3M8K8P6_9CORY|nr:hypothetical protein [Corynebacterium alimapuense]RNE49550.1 hypothetical protein C5L39_04150 [Corynebacterium alimapuense]
MSSNEQKWYFNPTTGEIDQGKKSSWANRMGPYDTREDAASALKIAAKRNADIDAAESEDDDWGKPAAW